MALGGSVLLGEREVPQPDLIVWEPVRGRGPVPDERVRLMAEVSDTTLADDPGSKRTLYAAASVPEYWGRRSVRPRPAPISSARGWRLCPVRGGAGTFRRNLRSATLVGLAVPTAALLDDGEERG